MPGSHHAADRSFLNGRYIFPLLSAVTLLAYGGLVLIDRYSGALRGQAANQTIALYLLAFIAYLAALLWLEHGGAWSARWAWGTGIGARFILLLTIPSLSDDIYRYIWDGHVAINGLSPYAYAVNDPTLDFLSIPERGLVNNAWMASPYLPAAQLLFYLAALIGRNPILVQGAMVLIDLAAALVIARLLSLAALPARRLLLYLWSPLVIVEVAHGAHVDAWMVLLTLLAVQASLKREPAGGRRILAPLFLALATLTKLLPALLAPVLFWRWSWFQRLLYPVLLLLALLPFGLEAGWGLNQELNGRGLFGAILIYSSRWKFNSGLFYALEKMLGGEHSIMATTGAKLLVAFLLAAVLLLVFILARRYSGSRATLRLAALPFMAYLLLTPTFHPWYLLIVLAFVPFLPPAAEEDRRWWLVALPWIYLSGAAIFSYLAYSDPAQVYERPWVRLLQWLPTILLLVAALVSLWRAPREDNKQAPLP
jgi:hypothetical protein